MRRTVTLQLPDNKIHLYDKFIELCTRVSLQELPLIRQELAKTVDRLREYKDRFLGPQLATVDALAKAANGLLDRYDAFSEDEQEQVIGAVRYFILTHDASEDTTAISGLDDDVLVMNGVLESLGLASEQIPTVAPVAEE